MRLIFHLSPHIKSKAIRGVWVILILLTTSCASSTNQMWNSRVGSYGKDQAILDLGYPQKAAILNDGTQVNEWLTRFGTRGSLFYRSGPTFDARAFDYSVLPWDAPQIPDEYLRLLFAPDGKLIAWDRKYR
jgi:hypothetical protein